MLCPVLVVRREKEGGGRIFLCFVVSLYFPSPHYIHIYKNTHTIFLIFIKSFFVVVVVMLWLCFFLCCRQLTTLYHHLLWGNPFGNLSFFFSIFDDAFVCYLKRTFVLLVFSLATYHTLIHSYVTVWNMCVLSTYYPCILFFFSQESFNWISSQLNTLQKATSVHNSGNCMRKQKT